jgi:hypothetical protein
MYQTIKNYLLVLLAIVGKAATRALIEELVTTAAKPPKKPRTMADDLRENLDRAQAAPIPEYHSQGPSAEDLKKRAARIEDNQFPFVNENSDTREFHDVLLVAFDLRGSSAEEVQNWLKRRMPRGDTAYHSVTSGLTVTLDSWWIANDERFDGSDCDSAVFVKPGMQEISREVLRQHGLGR